MILALVVATATMACVTKKKRTETSKFGKFYQNTTAYYNGYWNANEILKESLITLRAANVDDYNKILEVEDFIAVDNPKMVKPEMDKIQEKVSTVAQLHEASDWVDDCYVMMGKAQYLKHEYETAEETLEYFQEDFNPSNPYGRNYKSKKPTGKAAKKAREVEKKEKEKEREKVKEEKQEAKEEKAKTKEEERKAKAKAREKEKKEKEKQRKEAAKNRKKGIKTPKTTKEETKTVEPTPTTSTTKKPEEVVVKEEDIYKPITPEKPVEDKTAFSEGMLWLAKTYIKRENWFAAQILLEKLDKGFKSDELKAELPATFANLYLKQERYDEALPYLDEAIEASDVKSLKARYAFIAGQISQKNKNVEAALNYFDISKKYASDPKMEFMSELAVAKNGIASGKRSKESVIEDFKKLLNEDKYVQVKDQIYFTLAEIELSQNNEEAAIGYYKNSLAANVGDQKLKSEAYYRVANLYYDKQKYLFASNYFDSTLTLLPLTDVRQVQVKKYVDNLKDIAANLEIIAYQDTLLYFASLVDDNKEKMIIAYLARNQKNTQQPSAKSTTLSSKQNISSGVDFGTSTFFAYNKSGKEKGKDDFNKAWGKRSLEDDWRRSTKSTGINASESDSKDTKPNEAEPIEDKVSKEALSAYLREIPSNPVKVQEAKDKIITAMFVLGKLFRDKIENFATSAETLENMHTRFGPTQYELDSYFYIYLDYLSMDNPTKAAEYKNNIIRKYPDSKYAAILVDPNYFAKSTSKLNKEEQYYSTTYDMFEKGDYAKALSAINQSNSVIGDEHSYKAKFALLKAMCIGNTEGKAAYLKALNEVVTSFPNSPEQIKAKEIVRFLGGDNSAFADVRDVDKIFQRDETGTHYVAVITYGLAEDQQVNFKIAISEYNKKNFKNERLQMGDGMLNIEENAQVILIRKFDNEAKSIEYYSKVIKDVDEFSGGGKFTYDVLPLSQTNYRKMMNDKTAINYRRFFEQNMLPK